MSASTAAYNSGAGVKPLSRMESLLGDFEKEATELELRVSRTATVADRLAGNQPPTPGSLGSVNAMSPSVELLGSLENLVGRLRRASVLLNETNDRLQGAV